MSDTKKVTDWGSDDNLFSQQMEGGSPKESPAKEEAAGELELAESSGGARVNKEQPDESKAAAGGKENGDDGEADLEEGPVDPEDIDFRETGYETNRGLVDGSVAAKTE